MGRIADLLRSPFSFFGARASSQDRVVSYLIREHERGRDIDEILEDPYVKNRCTPEQKARLLDRPEVIRALGAPAAAPKS